LWKGKLKLVALAVASALAGNYELLRLLLALKAPELRARLFGRGRSFHG
jgi:hypothetical protein